MLYFIKIPIDSNFQAFKADYLRITGEKIQDNPQENAEQTHYLVGSSRLTRNQLDRINLKYSTVAMTRSRPMWKDKVKSEIK